MLDLKQKRTFSIDTYSEGELIGEKGKIQEPLIGLKEFGANVVNPRNPPASSIVARECHRSGERMMDLKLVYVLEYPYFFSMCCSTAVIQYRVDRRCLLIDELLTRTVVREVCARYCK